MSVCLLMTCFVSSLMFIIQSSPVMCCCRGDGVRFYLATLEAALHHVTSDQLTSHVSLTQRFSDVRFHFVLSQLIVHIYPASSQ